MRAAICNKNSDFIQKYFLIEALKPGAGGVALHSKYLQLNSVWWFSFSLFCNNCVKITEPGISGLEKRAPSGKLEFFSRSH